MARPVVAMSNVKPTPTPLSPIAGPQAAGEHGAAGRFYRDMFEHGVWGMFQTTPDGHYLNANPALARIYGYDSPAAMMAALTDIGSQLYADPARRGTFVRLMRENGAVVGFESAVHRRDGAVIWISESCREVRGLNGALQYYEGTVEEITTRKRAEEELCAAKEMAEAASRAKSAFLANMSHELRTPLNAVLGFAEVLRDELYGPLGDARYAAYAGDIHSSGKHLLGVINHILDLAKIEAGHAKLAEEEVDIGALMASCERLMAEPAARSRVTLKVVPPAETVSLYADETRLKQILLNLMSNAVKFTPEGHDVTVGTARAEDGSFLLIVADSGIGMTGAEIAKAFQPFQQIDSSLARRYDGTGLGLTLTKSLVELHGGELSLESEPGRGTVAIVRLPRSRILKVDTGAKAA